MNGWLSSCLFIGFSRFAFVELESHLVVWQWHFPLLGMWMFSDLAHLITLFESLGWKKFCQKEQKENDLNRANDLDYVAIGYSRCRRRRFETSKNA